MAGSGKTTLLQRLNAHVNANKIPTYIINLDPAVSHVPYAANIDIRDSVKYKEVMKSYGLGPNGGILTSLNLFSTKIDQVMSFVEKKRSVLKYILLDTPGQIEVFNWSASGSIITETFAVSMPTVYVYVVDTPRCVNTQTFMSNMLYACSLYYKTHLPLIIVFTKTDIVKHDYAVEWMKDFEKFEEACRANDTYAGNFTQSMSLMMSEFYNNFPCVAVSSLTGEGIDDFFKALENAGLDYESGYKVELEKKKEENAKKQAINQEKQMDRVRADLQKVVVDTKAPRNTIFLNNSKPSRERGMDGGEDDDGNDEDGGDDMNEGWDGIDDEENTKFFEDLKKEF
eukprot:TRINITY_DN1227_c0_g1_i4.p1 TRINITY_DN1227_c0_g1~~TRINITY_DN1227_c0_g1_i4.p1  ORF type:complete len:341 (-),score=92.12 TRINITY_DN1227_c0_g1_i4:16-1038(-)